MSHRPMGSRAGSAKPLQERIAELRALGDMLEASADRLGGLPGIGTSRVIAEGIERVIEGMGSIEAATPAPVVSASPGLVIETIFGSCPVQAAGTVDGKVFHFRARGTHWEVGIGADWDSVFGAPDWYYRELYGEWPSAGWMSQDEAHAFVEKAVALYRGASPPGNP